MMRIGSAQLVSVLASLPFLLAVQSAGAQTPTRGIEIPLQRCDRLPVVILQVEQADKRFLVDTAATSLLNDKSFTGGRTKEIHVQSWNETTVLKAPEVSIGELRLGSHSLRGVRLPAVDLTAMGKACGCPLDGILGVDLLEQMGVTIDLKRSVARLGIAPETVSEVSLIADMQQAMHSCSEAFNQADTDKLALCFDRDFVLSSPSGELHGRDQAVNHFRERYFHTTPHVHLSLNMNDQHAVGEVVWASYTYTVESPSVHIAGRGIMLCHKFENHWYILSMHESAF
jgi:hypothetical protein